jgi:hypothetical protein
MGRPATLTIKILGDSRGGRTALSETDRDLQTLGSAADTATRVATAALVGLGAAFAYTAKAASDQEQAVGALTAVFGANSAAMLTNAEAATAIGLSTADYAQQAAVLGAQLTNLGIPQSEVAAQTDELIGLGADLAAQFGGSTSDAVAALGSLLRGERDPIEAYGVSINQATIDSYLAAQGLSGLTGEAKTNAEAQAVLALVAEQTASAQGAFARESDTAAGSMAVAKAEITNAAAALGEVFLPYVADAAGALADMAGWVEKNSGLVTGLAAVLGTLAAVVVGINLAVKAAAAIQAAYNAVMAVARIAQLAYITVGIIATAVNWAMLGPILLIIAAIALVVVGIILLVKNWDKVLAVMKTVIGWIKDTAIAAWDALTKAIGKVVDSLKKVWDWIKKILDSSIGKIGNLIGIGKSAPSAAALTPAVVPGPRAAAAAAGGGGGVHFHFEGTILDRAALVRDIRQLLAADDAAMRGTPTWA